MIVLSNIPWCYAKGFCENRTIFQCHSLSSRDPSLSSRDPYFPVAWTGFQETVCSGHLCHTFVVADLQTRILVCSGA